MRIIVVGASVGIGEALCRALVADGHRVAALSRRIVELTRLEEGAGGKLRAIPHDVTAVHGIPGAFAAAVDWLQGCDAIVYNAGVLHPVEPDEYDTTKDLEVLAVNTVGAVAWLNEAATVFQRQRSGVIVGVGSVAGDRGRVTHPAYGASKAAIHSFLESLRNRLSGLGVRVVTIKPGPVNTAMTAGRAGLPFMVEPEVVARAIVRALTSGPEVVYVAPIWRWIMLVIRHIPSLIFRRLRV